eukprot:TRINITY_DN53208_c0_g1_i1.p1 TRINITY_DN53208_c0_g1~~TRINITY_DN53208_c0_g1_i1.p1  ORF type:complete len:334 (-),score=76.21 TRINITY_DN53208_c0_g1_i1:381-1382(-)
MAEAISSASGAAKLRTAKRKKRCTQSAESAAEERLAALGEAFLASIDGDLPSSARRVPRKQVESAGTDIDNAARKQSKKRKKTRSKDGLSAQACTNVTSPASKTEDVITAAAKTPTASKLPKEMERKPESEAEVPTASSPSLPDKSAGCSRPKARVLQIPGRAAPASERRRFMSDKVSQIRATAAPPPPRGRHKDADKEDSEEFKRTLKEVLNFVTPQLGKAERRQFERSRILAQGGTLESRPHEPYAHVVRQRKAQEEARQRRLAEEKLLGVSTSFNQHRRGYAGDSAILRKKEAALAKKRRKDNDILNVGLGAKESRGMYVIPKKNLRAYS